MYLTSGRNDAPDPIGFDPAAVEAIKPIRPVAFLHYISKSGPQPKTQSGIAERELFGDLSLRYPPGGKRWTRPDLLERCKYLCIQRASLDLPLTHVPPSGGGPRDLLSPPSLLSSDIGDNGFGYFEQPKPLPPFVYHLSNGILFVSLFRTPDSLCNEFL